MDLESHTVSRVSRLLERRLLERRLLERRLLERVEMFGLIDHSQGPWLQWWLLWPRRQCGTTVPTTRTVICVFPKKYEWRVGRWWKNFRQDRV